MVVRFTRSLLIFMAIIAPPVLSQVRDAQDRYIEFPSIAQSPYGIHTHLARNDEHPFLKDEIALMHQAGIRWMRTGFVWSAIEQKNEEFNFANCDQTVDVALNSNIQIMGLLHGTPGWAKPTIEHLDEWLDFVKTTVSRYKDRVPSWQIWNEPNLDHFWEDPNPADYARLLKATYREIKRIDPEAIVVWGGTSRLDWTFLDPALAQSDGLFDVMAMHPYGYGDPRSPEAYIPDALDELRALMTRHGLPPKPVWFTEWGWPTHTGRRGISDRQQGQYIARAYILAAQNGMDCGFWYEFQERNASDEENEDAFGILEYDLKPKPAYKAYSTLIKARPAGSKISSKPWKTGLIYHPAWTRPDGTTVHAVWNVWGRWKTPRMVPVRLEGEMTAAFDYLGESISLETNEDGTVTLPLDWGSPIYLIGPEEIRFE